MRAFTKLCACEDYNTNPTLWDCFEFSGDADYALREIGQYLDDCPDNDGWQCGSWRPGLIRPAASHLGQ